MAMKQGIYTAIHLIDQLERLDVAALGVEELLSAPDKLVQSMYF